MTGSLVPLPPKGFRLPITKRMKDQILARQGCRCAESGFALAVGKTHFDHQPAIADREWDASARDGRGDTIPPCQDIAFIFAVDADWHVKVKTPSDLRRMGKVRRLRKQQAEWSEMLAAKEPGQPRVAKGTIRSRGFQKGTKRRWGQKRNFRGEFIFAPARKNIG